MAPSRDLQHDVHAPRKAVWRSIFHIRERETLDVVASQRDVSVVLRALQNNISVVLVRPFSAGYVNPPRGSVMSASPKVETACAAKRPFVRDLFSLLPF